MSTRGTHGLDTGGRGRGRRGIQAESFASDMIPNLDTSETPVSPITETGTKSQNCAAGDDALSQAMLQILERVAVANTRFGGRRSVMERLRSNGVEIFRSIAGVAPNVAEYWMEATERIMDDVDFTVEQKLKGAISLLRDEAYQWWLTGKYVGASYIDTRRSEFLNLTQEDHTVAEYEADFLRLSGYARGMVATEYEYCVRFENGLRDNLKVQITPQRERKFTVLIEKAKITEEVKRAKRQNRDRGKAKRDTEPSNVGMRPRKKARSSGPVRVGPTVALTGVVICQLCDRRYSDECWRSIRAYLRCESTEHRVKDCLLRGNQIQALVAKTAQPPREVQQPPRGQGQARGSNSMSRGQRAPDRDVRLTEAR
ncbi:uncharacterized protein [Gossypium hirsutum]|uniref:Retrotransposon gag domain-containing protein n=1 Tax=Gossypium hirsutum TaxID=3635 RepID=A0A1U8KNY1_GOSHI|nr:uncharacterized protein LOC107919174 [Gossypium hirsutum]